jgi:hypothetical protein
VIFRFRRTGATVVSWRDREWVDLLTRIRRLNPDVRLTWPEKDETVRPAANFA